MKTLAQVELKNYRSHENSIIEFGMLTSIIGENDQGKSNVYRALDMVLTNAPFTEAQLRYGTKEGSVKVTFTDGTWIERTRKGTKQTCMLSTMTQPFDTIKDITNIVQEFTGFKAITLDKNSKPESIQLIPIDAGQSYLVSGTSPDGVLRRINRLMSGSGIETARIVLDKELRVIEKSNAIQEIELTKQTKMVDCLDNEVWGEITEELEATTKKLKVLDKLEETESLLIEFQDVAMIAATVIAAREAFGDTLQKTYTLRDKIASIKALEQRLVNLQGWQKTINESLDVLDVVYKRDDELAKEIETVRNDLDTLRAQEQAVKLAEAQAKALEEEKVCPTCKRPL